MPFAKIIQAITTLNQIYSISLACHFLTCQRADPVIFGANGIPISNKTLISRNPSDDGQHSISKSDNSMGSHQHTTHDQAFLNFILAGKGHDHKPPFELVVLETAFSNVVSKLKRHQVRSIYVL